MPERLKVNLLSAIKVHKVGFAILIACFPATMMLHRHAKPIIMKSNRWKRVEFCWKWNHSITAASWGLGYCSGLRKDMHEFPKESCGCRKALYLCMGTRRMIGVVNHGVDCRRTLSIEWDGKRTLGQRRLGLNKYLFHLQLVPWEEVLNMRHHIV